MAVLVIDDGRKGADAEFVGRPPSEGERFDAQPGRNLRLGRIQLCPLESGHSKPREACSTIIT